MCALWPGRDRLMAPRGRIEFLERNSYRQRRMRDAARMLPIFGAVLMLLPLMWPRETDEQSLTSSGIYYLFGLWIALVVISFILSRMLRFEAAGSTDKTGKDPAEGDR